jgi:hypothetical protein
MTPWGGQRVQSYRIRLFAQGFWEARQRRASHVALAVAAVARLGFGLGAVGSDHSAVSVSTGSTLLAAEHRGSVGAFGHTRGT